MPEQLRFAGQIIFLLYGVSVMILVSMSKVGKTMGAITKTEYRPGSSDTLLGWSRRTKIIHAIIFTVAAIFAFWPAH